MCNIVGVLSVTHFSDPGCPWAYSSAPYLTLMRWRYGDQLQWTNVMIGLAEDPQRYVDRGYTPTMMAQGYARFRRFGMPFATQPRPRVGATGRACRAVVAVRRLEPEHVDAAFRALQFTQFCSTALLDTVDGLRSGLERVDGLDAGAVLEAIEDPATEEAYQADRALTRTAEGTPSAFQGRTANSDGLERYTAPSLIFTAQDGRSLEVGGFQPAEAYDVAIANLDRTLTRRAPAEDPVEALRAFPYPLTTREIATVTAGHLADVDQRATEQALIAAAGAEQVTREAVGDDALWHLA